MAKILLVTSPKGGTGKTTVSMLLGQALAAEGKNVLLIELDFGLRGLDLMLAASDRVVFDLSDVAFGRCAPVDAINQIKTSGGNFHYIAAPNDRFFDIDKDKLHFLLSGYAGCYDFMILDLGAGIGAAFDTAAAVCDMALLISTCDEVSLRKTAAAALLLSEKDCRLVINKFRSTQLRGRLRHLDDAIDRAMTRLISVIPLDEALSEAVNCGENPPPNSKALLEIGDLAQRICGNEKPLNQKRLK